MMYYTYNPDLSDLASCIVRCSDNTLYTGYTDDPYRQTRRVWILDKRIATHNTGKGAKYTKPRLPVELVYFEEYDTKSVAMKREYAIKRMSRSKKEEMIISFRVST